MPDCDLRSPKIPQKGHTIYQLKVYFVFPIFPAIEPIQEFNSIIICYSILRAFKLPLPQYLKVLTHSLKNHSHYDISTCESASLLKLLESVISKLSIQIIWTSDSFFSFHHFQERQILQKVSSCEKSMHISDQRNHFLSKCSDSLPLRHWHKLFVEKC